MERREFTRKLSGVLILGSTAGCASLGGGSDVKDSDGDGGIDSEDYAPNDPDVQEKSDITGEDSSDDSGSSDGSDSDSSSNGGENDEKKVNMVADYEQAYRGVETGKDLIGTAIDSYDSEMYGTVISSLDGFEDSMNSWVDEFQKAASAAGDMGYSSVQSSAKSGKSEAQQLGNAGTHLKESAEYAQEENWDLAESKLGQAQTALKNAEDSHQQLMKPSEVKNKVGYSGP